MIKDLVTTYLNVFGQSHVISRGFDLDSLDPAVRSKVVEVSDGQSCDLLILHGLNNFGYKELDEVASIFYTTDGEAIRHVPNQAPDSVLSSRSFHNHRISYKAEFYSKYEEFIDLFVAGAIEPSSTTLPPDMSTTIPPEPPLSAPFFIDGSEPKDDDDNQPMIW